MPKKDKQTDAKKEKPTEVKSEVKDIKVEVKDVKVEIKTEEPPKKSKKMNQDQDQDDDNDGVKKQIVKPGRTLLVSPAFGSTIKESVISSLDGLKNSFSTKNGSYFLTFDTVENSTKALKKLKDDHSNLKTKFSRYQIFFTINGLSNDNDYSTVKKLITDHVEQNTGGMVLYFKLYRKGDNYFFDTKGEKPIGYGDLTVDTKESMDLLLNKEGLFKNYNVKFDAKEMVVEKDGKKETVMKKAIDLSGTFYRFNKNPKNDTNQKALL